MSNGNQEQRVEQIMITKTRLVIAIAAAAFAFAGMFFKIQLDIALIKQNHIAHIESIMKEIEVLKKTDEGAALERKDLMEYLIANNSKLDQIIGKLNR